MTLDLDEFILGLFARLSLPRLDEGAAWELAEACRLFLDAAATEDPETLVAGLAARFQTLRSSVEDELGARLATLADSPGELETWLKAETEGRRFPAGNGETAPKTITEGTAREPDCHQEDRRPARGQRESSVRGYRRRGRHRRAGGNP